MHCLDKSRLGNQVWREGLTLIRGGWKWHPASKMWRGYEYHLGLYLLAGITVLCYRSGKYYAEVKRKIIAEMENFPDTGTPPWMGDNRLHSSHRAALLAKNFQWYSQFGWSESPDPMVNDKYAYWWPTKNT